MRRPTPLPDPQPVQNQKPKYVLHIEQNRFIQNFRKQKIISRLENLTTNSIPLTKNLAKHLYATKDTELYKKIASNPKSTSDTLNTLNEHLKTLDVDHQTQLEIVSSLLLNPNITEPGMLSLLKTYPELLPSFVLAKQNLPETIMFHCLNQNDINLMSLLLLRKDLTDNVLLKTVKTQLPLETLNLIAAKFVSRSLANKSASFQYEWVRLSYLQGKERNIFNDYTPVLLQEAKYDVAEKLFISVDISVIPNHIISEMLRNKFQTNVNS